MASKILRIILRYWAKTPFEYFVKKLVTEATTSNKLSAKIAGLEMWGSIFKTVNSADLDRLFQVSFIKQKRENQFIPFLESF